MTVTTYLPDERVEATGENPLTRVREVLLHQEVEPDETALTLAEWDALHPRPHSCRCGGLMENHPTSTCASYSENERRRTPR